MFVVCLRDGNRTGAKASALHTQLLDCETGLLLQLALSLREGEKEKRGGSRKRGKQRGRERERGGREKGKRGENDYTAVWQKHSTLPHGLIRNKWTELITL